jgi:ribosomal protein S18 acetylase RimI-like enzyme
MYQHLSAGERQGCVARSMQLVRDGDLLPEDILVIRGAAGLRGVMVCCAGGGACGQIWPPQAAAREPRAELEDALIQDGLARLQHRGARFIQCLLAPEDADCAPALTRNGFHNPTKLLLLRQRVESNGDDPVPSAPPFLAYRTYQECESELYAATLLRTYDETLDFPELNGFRNGAEVIEGHKSYGLFDPALWLLAFYRGQAAGVLLLARDPDAHECELAYMGVVPEARGHGIGRALVRLAVRAARELAAAQLTVSVDGRNEVAFQLYLQEGFEVFDERNVYLIF